MKKRLLLLSDFHCGSKVGLTPPEYRGGSREERKIQDECWQHFEKAEGEHDVVVINGDLIDGPGSKNSGIEQLTTNRKTQAEWAAECIKAICPSKKTPIYSTYGTRYHTGDAEDFEDDVVTALKNAGYNAFPCKSHLWLKVDNVTFDFKHHCGGSSIPHGRHSAVARERLWNILWSDVGQSPRANVIVRSHVHYHNFCGGSDWLAMTTPALQGLGNTYGSRRCSGTVDFGYITFDIDGHKWDWASHILKFVAQRDKAAVV